MENNPMNIAATPWEKVAETKWGRYIFNTEKKVILKASAISKSKKNVFEVGCEGGVWLSLLKDNGWIDLSGNEILQKHINLCHKRIPGSQITMTNPDSKILNKNNNSQDLLIVMEVPSVINSLWLNPEANRILKPGGLLVASITNKNSFRFLVLKIMKIFGKKQLNHLETSYSSSYNEFKNILENNNMQIVYGIGYCWFPFSRSSNSFLIPIFVFIEKLFFLDKILTFSPWVCIIAQKKL